MHGDYPDSSGDLQSSAVGIAIIGGGDPGEMGDGDAAGVEGPR
jgi:hypothetical protein